MSKEVSTEDIRRVLGDRAIDMMTEKFWREQADKAPAKIAKSISSKLKKERELVNK